MKVKCIINNIHAVENYAVRDDLSYYIRMPDGEVDIELGKIYTVYGIEFRGNAPWFYICGDESSEYPKPYSSVFFEKADGRLSKYWVLNETLEGGQKNKASLVAKEWAENTSFYEQLLNGDFRAIAVFSELRRLMDLE